MEIKNKVALVTGASSGIGKAIARELLEHGAYCAMASRDETRLNQIAREWEGEYPQFKDRILPVRLDVLSEHECKKAVEACQSKWGRLDILVNNAGHGTYGPSTAVPPEEVRLLFDVHYLGSLRMILASLDLLKKSGDASIVMVTSIAALIPPPWMGHYSGIKAAMNALTNVLRFELMPYGIRMTTVMPGITKTEFGIRAKYFGGAQWSRAGMGGATPQEVAEASVRAIQKEKRDLVVGLGNRLMVRGARALAPILDKCYARLFGPWD